MASARPEDTMRGNKTFLRNISHVQIKIVGTLVEHINQMESTIHFLVQWCKNTSKDAATDMKVKKDRIEAFKRVQELLAEIPHKKQEHAAAVKALGKTRRRLSLLDGD